jgi:hypothetical protein
MLAHRNSAGLLAIEVLDERRSALRRHRPDLLPNDSSRISHSRVHPCDRLRIGVKGFDDYPRQ